MPKSQVSLRLVDEIAQVLHVSQVNRSYERLLGCLTRNEFSFQLSNDVALIDPLVDLLLQMMTGMRLCDSTGRVRVGLAIEHALLNALYRGNLEISLAEMLTTREMMVQGPPSAGLAEQRSSQSPYCDRKIGLEVTMSPDEARFVIRDEGPGFDSSKLPGRGDPSGVPRRSPHRSSPADAPAGRGPGQRRKGVVPWPPSLPGRNPRSTWRSRSGAARPAFPF